MPKRIPEGQGTGVVDLEKIDKSVSAAAARFFSNSTSRRDVEPTTSTSTPSPAADAQAAHDLANATTSGPNPMKEQWMNPNTTTLLWAERKLLKQGIEPIGSRRRRAAVRQSPNIPFEQLPYHCFQEARKVLGEDRAEKLKAIRETSEEIKKLEARPADIYRAGEYHKQKKLNSLRRHLEYLKIQADINDPAVKRKWEDGHGDMSKPIYRYFAEQKWRSMAYKVLAQRVEQFNIVPDVLSKFDPKMDLQLSFHGYRVDPGEIVDSLVSEQPPNLRVQVFDGKERLVSVVVMDSDVPDPQKDAFGRRLHFMAANVRLSSLTKNISLKKVIEAQDQLAVPWLPPFSQEGAPYHRLSVWVLEQDGKLDVEQLKKMYSKRNGFSLQGFRSRYPVTPFGFNMFRSVWDEGTAKVMERHGIPGADLVFRRKRVHSLQSPKKARGWEAKRQGPKYRQLWKYTKRIGKMSGGR
ncbi:54S ribosomal protein L35, mitochondrial [Cytospora mali]|uniref:Large ribosomal subunit protein mL38 n=1 Tax=Cytospora mali TaxID=578113 RepID=A0A194V7W0_CYTMA|nr:54S ribosomal protein L35, mitochondrial [Valsa mali var. pyri (nom. inval.)]